MRLTLCVKRDLHGCIFLNHLLPQLQGHDISLLLSDKHRPGEQVIPELAEIAWLERTLPLTRIFPAIDALKAQPRTDGRWLTFQGLVDFYGFSVFTAGDRQSLADAIEQLQPELIISARFSLIFTEAMIAATRHGIINIHPAALPQFAGLFGPMRTLAEGHRQFTCAVHRVDRGIDSGPLLYQATLPIRPDEGLLHQIAGIYPLAIPYLLDALTRLTRGEGLPATAQDPAARRYRSFPDAAEIGAFVAQGHRFWDRAGYEALIGRFCPGWQMPSADTHVAACTG